MASWVQMVNLLKQAGGEIFNEDRMKSTFNSPAGIEAGQYFSDLVHKHQVHTPHGDYFKASGQEPPAFRRGTIAKFYETSAYRIVQWAQDIGGLENMYITPAPTKKQSFTGTFGSNDVMFKTNTEQQEAAWQVLRWITSTEPAAHYTKVIHFLPARRSIPPSAGVPADSEGRAAVPDVCGYAGARLPADPSRVRGSISATSTTRCGASRKSRAR